MGEVKAAARPTSHGGLEALQTRIEDAGRVALVEVLLEFQQLAHEVEIGADDGALAFDVFVGVAHGHLGVLEDVGDGDGGRARHTRMAVNQHAGAVLPGIICNERSEVNDRKQ